MKQGYKQSPLGPIPEDWEVRRLGEIGEVLMCKRIMKYQTDSCGDIPFFKIGTFGGKPDAYISREVFDEYKAKYSYPKVGDVLISAAGTIGRSVIFDGTPSYYQDSNIVWIDNDNKQLLNKYLYYYYSTINWITDTGTIPRLYNGALKAIQIPTPPIEQQKRIVSILELWDTAIAKQTELVEKLTLRKRGLMQQLLTGKKRLKGFEKGAFQRLGNYITECNRRNNGCNRVLSVTNTRGFILQEEQFDKIVASNNTSNYKVVRQGEFAYNPSRVNVGSLAMLNEYDEGILSPMYIVFKANENIDKNYLLQCLQSYWFRGHIPAYTQGSVRDSLSFDGLCSMKFYIPTPQEQKAISAILEYADKEIELANEKLARLQEEKRGLMQVLLSGKKRIKSNNK